MTYAVGPQMDAMQPQTCDYVYEYFWQVDDMKVLIAVEDSLYGGAIADFLIRNQWRETPAFKVVNVVPPTKYLIPTVTGVSDLRYIEVLEDRRQRGRKLILDMENLLRQAFPNSSIEGLVVDGDPRSVICDAALEWQASMIVMGSHSRTGFKRLLLGSVSSSVLSHASCSVTIVRLTAAQTKQCENGHESHLSAQKIHVETLAQ